MDFEMKAVLFYGPQDIRYENTMIKPLFEGEILVKVEAALTCGTDVKTFRRGHPVLIKEIPSGFGHEFAGIVEKVLGYLTENGLYPHGIVNAPVRKGKNIEYILYCKPDYNGAKTVKQITEEVKNFVRRNSLGELL